MNYCFNPNCPKPDDFLNANLLICRNCGTELLLQNRYRGIQLLGKGGFCKIIELDDSGKRKVGKILFNNYYKAIELFQREAEILKLLEHPGIPKVEPDGYFTFSVKNQKEPCHCLVMEKVDGLNLKDWQSARQNQPITQAQAIDWLKQLTEILGYLHKNNYFHRDIKPDNIILKPDGTLVLIDFNAVREVTDTYLAKVGVNRDITQIGSKGYIPLEQVSRRAVPQSDFYALGCTFIHLLTGIHPIDIDDEPKTGKLNWRQYAPHISLPLAELIDWLIAPLPEQRPQNTQVILQHLVEIESLITNQNSIPIRESLKSVNKFFGKRILTLVQVHLLKVRIAVAAILGLSGLWLFSPMLADSFNRNGYKYYMNEKLEKARLYFSLAVQLNPQFWEAHFNLGATCEKQGNLKCARAQYQIAIQDQDKDTAAAAINNLGRLEILDREYNRAILLFLQGINRTKDTRIKSDLYKNLGWANFQEKQYAEATKHLQTAIKLAPDKASPYCLMALVLQSKNNFKAALPHWKNCQTNEPKKDSPLINPEEKMWKIMALKHLQTVSLQQER
jgi:serine/threonine protein kinase